MKKMFLLLVMACFACTAGFAQTVRSNHVLGRLHQQCQSA